VVPVEPADEPVSLVPPGVGEQVPVVPVWSFRSMRGVLVSQHRDQRMQAAF
jgi:hypothetical protein